jgi:hypothetical protein
MTTIVDIPNQRAVDAPAPKTRTMTQVLAGVEQAITDARDVFLGAEARQVAADADLREAEQILRRLERFRAALAGDPEA